MSAWVWSFPGPPSTYPTKGLNWIIQLITFENDMTCIKRPFTVLELFRLLLGGRPSRHGEKMEWRASCWRLPLQVKGLIHTLPETNSKFAPANRSGPKRKRSYSNHPFSGVNSYVSFRGGVIHTLYGKFGTSSKKWPEREGDGWTDSQEGHLLKVFSGQLADC